MESPDLPSAIERLKSHRKIHFELGKAILHRDLSSSDYFPCGVLGRSLSNSRAFLMLVEDRNYLGAIPFVRMQLDNVLRFHALFISMNSNEFIEKFVEGEHIRKMKDFENKEMTDAYLLKSFIKHYPEEAWIKTAYERSSGYVHLSHIHSDAIILKTHQNSIELLITDKVNLNDDIYLEAVNAFNHLSEIIFALIAEYANAKEKYHKEHFG